MKNILFSAYSLDFGGIETALITLLKYLNNEYKITLVLEKKQGIYLNDLPKEINVITYTPSNMKFIPLRKVINYIKRIKFTLKYKNKFDFSADFATYSMSSSFVARTASQKSAIWIHNNYMNFYDNDEQKYKDFFKSLKIEKFKKIVFVSNLDKEIFLSQFQGSDTKLIVCNNLINYKKIQEMSEEKIELEKEDITTFINVSRHDEKQKKISRIINSAEKLVKEGYKFKVLLIGKGTATKEYEESIKNKKLNNVMLLGAKKNPYPYFKISDCFLLSSEFEGYPVVLVEAQILGLPIVTTNISDSNKDIDGKYGIVVDNSEDGVYNGMKTFLEKKIETSKFEPEKYNEEIIEKVREIISD